ncbi:hypothetical protein MUGA111182_05800 [Mucilaginibacter galii]|uniref:Uncharacterized protein n=1 Tax=Mucilaginibacter galii TaxID=2005073 RepID=A0A917J8C4_9SPHI|nr:hypothetical protein [Mucilaginibacter galii]GGI49977.1 hypothetical protein GCM10011425_11890 [Mucilaginibacter galii]
MNNNDTQPQSAALLVHTCDRYRFLYPGFSYFFNKNWDFKANCKYYFATEKVNFTLPHFQNIHSGKGEWSDRLRYLLQEVITEKYVLYFQEDMWLQKPVSSSFINELITLARQFEWKHVKLGSADIYKTHPTHYYIDGFNVTVLDNAASDYLMSHQVTLWDREFLIQQLHKGEHPWRNERRGTKRLKKLDPEIFHIDYFAENGQVPINNNLSEAVRSEYHTVSANSMLQANVLPYIKQMQSGNAEEKDYAAQLTAHYENKLTHDGLPKPHKQDIFKKIKNLFKS